MRPGKESQTLQMQHETPARFAKKLANPLAQKKWAG